ncbi:glycosyltransferase family 4 protein [Desulfovirgula thermocuniculi]|uniref:glycosyltransferase family 4 protein n=1 Tax=Desulfovirgula thermocuniculi TaxID=348842 RepID=UPI00068452F1|nr:glycosyltransferase family 4 protein [Desulfovirgula thermocuniculi]
MKIIFLTAEPPWPLDQGDKLRNYHLLKALAAEHEVTLVTFCPPGEEKGSWQRAIAPLCRAVYPVPLGQRQMLLNVLRLPHLPVTMAARASARVVRLLRQLTQEQGFDVAYACQLKMAGYLRHCASCRRVADLTDVVSLLRRRMLRFAPSWPAKVFNGVETHRLAFWERWVARSADLVLLVSPVDAAELARIAPGARIAVLPNGVDLDCFRPLPDPGRPVLFFWGHLRYPPNADGIVWFCQEIFPAVREVLPDAELLVVGKEPPPEVVALGSLPGVKVVGYVPDLRPYLAQASLVVVPLRFGTGIRNKILEAFAAGRPVVSTPLGCEGLEVRPGVHLEVVGDPRSFAEAVIDLLRNPTRRAYLAVNARKVVEQIYNWEAIGRRLGVLVEELGAGEK